MNSGKGMRDMAHREATRLASERRCLSCHEPAPSLPAHYPRHRGMGGGHAGWDVREWVPLCYKCHEILDHRQGKHEDWVKVHHWIEINLERGEWP